MEIKLRDSKEMSNYLWGVLNGTLVLAAALLWGYLPAMLCFAAFAIGHAILVKWPKEEKRAEIK